MSNGRAVPWLGLALAVALAAGIGLPGLDRPGLYYDEVIQAEPALAFLRGEPQPAIPGLRSVSGTGFPWMTQPYMGALKSQLLVPVFAIAEPSATRLRGATFGIALAGLVLWGLWARRTFGDAVACVAVVLLACDASFVFIARHDWGSFAIGLALRGGALLGLSSAARSGSSWAGFAGGLAAGLALYNKIDAVVFLAAAGVAAVAVAHAELRTLLRTRPAWLWAAGAGALLGVAPLAFALGDAVAATRAFSTAAGSAWAELGEKLILTGQVLDGSYFHRLILAGGRFEALADVGSAARGPGGLATAIALAVLGGFALRGDDSVERRHARFLAILTLACFALLLLLPRAVRVHHTLNAWPLPQLCIAAAGAALWRATNRNAARAALALVGVALVVANLRVDAAIHTTLRETGGQGRWSDAVVRYGETLPETATVVGLDWGFAGPLRFTRADLRVDEPIWLLRRPRAPRRAIALEGTADHRYLVLESDLAVFPFGAAFLRAVEQLEPGAARVQVHRDGAGDAVFREVRLRAAHRWLHRGQRFQLEWTEGTP